MTKGQISRHEPLDLAITTAGAEYESQLWWREYSYAKQVLAGSLQSDRFYAAIWEADAKRVEEDPDYWKSREARVAANPSHEDLGGFLKDAAIKAELDKAINEPSERSKYLRYHLNVPIKAQEDPIIDMSKWQRNDGGVDLRKWPEYDVELLIRKWGLIDQPCWAGVDASWTTDLTAVVFGFPPFGKVDQWTFLPFVWMPRERVPELERICRVPFSDWIRRGFIEATPGNAIDLRAIKERLRWGKEMFELREVAYDREFPSRSDGTERRRLSVHRSPADLHAPEQSDEVPPERLRRRAVPARQPPGHELDGRLPGVAVRPEGQRAADEARARQERKAHRHHAGDGDAPEPGRASGREHHQLSPA
jgi:phage terminase large subunit-like protein